MLGPSGTLLCICAFDTWEYNFWYPWTILFLRIYCMLGLSGTSSYAVFVYLYLCICTFDTWEYHFWYPWTILFSKIYHILGLSGTSSYAVFVYLCICIYVFAHLTHGSIIFDTLEQSSFQKYTTCWVFLALCHMPYLCICVFVYLCNWIFVFAHLKRVNIIFDTSELSSFQKYTSCWVY